LRLAAASRSVLKGEQKVILRQQAKGRPVRARAAAPATGLDGADDALWQRLRAWRGETAKAHGVPAYVIFHDATLLALARARPRDLARLQDVPGIGATKLQRYGEALLAVCRDHAAEPGDARPAEATSPLHAAPRGDAPTGS
jgi:ATP-dependent DNA helicase RecQ